MKPLILGLLASLAAVQGGLAQERATALSQPLRGQVVDVANNVPLRRARVTVTVGDRSLDPVVTDDEGRFAIANVPAASLTLRVAKAGYAAALLPLPAERAETDLRFALTRSAAVMGRVLDAYGAAVGDVFVTARGIRPAGDTAPAASTQFYTRTDALGEYRLGSLPPGRYTVMAARVPAELRGPAGKTEELLFDPSARLDAARGTQAVTLAAGDEIESIDFTITGSAETCPTGPSVKPPDGATTATIRGRVTVASGEPLACAIVSIVASDVSIPQVYTDPQGRYSIEGLPAGPVVIEARKIGYVSLQYGQRRPSDAETLITLRERERRSDTDIVLPRGSIVSGTVVDEHGEPVEGIPIAALQLGRLESWTTATSGAFPRSTDDRGRYRLTGLDPGTYLVASMATYGVSSARTGETRAYTSTYYPGTSDVLTAQRLVLEAGRNADGIDIAFAPTRTATVSGSVFDAAGRPFNGSVAMTHSARSGAAPVGSWSAPIDSSGRFEVRNVPPGDYVVKGLDSPFEARQFTMQYVRVADVDPAPVTMTVSEGATVDGSLSVEDASSPDGLGIVVWVKPADPDYAPNGIASLMTSIQSTSASTLDGGRFRIVRVRGPSRLHVATPRCESCYLKSAFVNGADAADTPFDFGLAAGTFREVEIVVSDGGAAIEGRVTDERDETVGSFNVVVFSTERDLWYSASRYTKGGQSRDGSFRVTGLPPGEYFVAAVSRVDPVASMGRLNDPDLLEQLAARAQRVTLSERERRTLHLRLSRR